jgi:hypothetical protein
MARPLMAEPWLLTSNRCAETSLDAPSWRKASVALEGALRPLREIFVVGASLGGDRGRDKAESHKSRGEQGFHGITSWILNDAGHTP